MTYKLLFKKSALKEWGKLTPPTQAQLKKKLAERLESPHIQADKLRDLEGCYKIKLRSAGYRLVYQVADDVITVTVITVGKRDKGQVYQKAKNKLTTNK